MFDLVKYTFTQIILSYSKYEGSGMFMLLLFISLVYIYTKNDVKKDIPKVFLLYYSLLTLVFIFNPMTAHFIIKYIGDFTYWRMFWLLPIYIVIAFVATDIIVNMSVKYKKVILVFAFILIIFLCGKFIFTTTNYSSSANWFKLPSETIEVCEIIEKDTTGKIRVVVPTALESSIRQYDANIQMPYGRDGGDSTGVISDSIKNFHTLMQDSVLNVDLVSVQMRAFVCNYIVLNKTTLPSADMKVYGYTYIASTKSYDIYRFPADGMNADE